jgi:hypothetical protein
MRKNKKSIGAGKQERYAATKGGNTSEEKVTKNNNQQ